MICLLDKHYLTSGNEYDELFPNRHVDCEMRLYSIIFLWPNTVHMADVRWNILTAGKLKSPCFRDIPVRCTPRRGRKKKISLQALYPPVLSDLIN